MLWTAPAWRAEADAWITEQVERTGRAITGPIDQFHVYPWATVMRVPTSSGTVYFKAASERFAYEARVLEFLGCRLPEVIAAPLAVDTERGWMLMTDAGTTVRAQIESERSLARWLDVLPMYAQVQIDVADAVPELLELGVPDLRLEKLPDAFAAFLKQLEPSGWSEVRDARDKLGAVRRACRELAAFGIAETLQHDDFHDAQVFIREGRYLLLDWGDACISHPFFTMSVTLQGTIEWGLDDVEGSEDITPFRDAYLAPFVTRYPVVDLNRALDLALPLGWACRVINGHIAERFDHTRTRLQMFLKA